MLHKITAEAFRADSTTERGGKLHFDKLPLTTGERVETIVDTPSSADGTWLESYFTATFGGIPDDSFFRQPPG
jgi:hypothetical protein